MSGLVIRGGTVWSERDRCRADVLIEGDRVAAVGEIEPDGRATVDATGLAVLPGLIDVHVHADDTINGCDLADSFASAGAVALANGVTTIGSFATQRPGETLTEAAERMAGRARHSRGRVALHLTPTGWPWDWDEIADLVDRGFVTFKLYTTYRDAGLYTPYDRLEEAMQGLAALGATLLVHCEDDEAVRLATEADDEPAAATGHPERRPAAAEDAAVAAVVTLAADTGCATHVVHVSTPEGAELVAVARRRARVTCETAPHYLLLDRRRLAADDGHRFLCTPPLRDPESRSHLEGLAAAGAFDLLATDHCAFTRADKDRHRDDARLVPQGLAGLGALVPLAYEVLVRRHGCSLAELVRVLSANPARLLGAYPERGVIAAGGLADLVLLDEHGPDRPVVSSFADCHEAYAGCTTPLLVRRAFVGGREVVRDGELVPGP